MDRKWFCSLAVGLTMLSALPAGASVVASTVGTITSKGAVADTALSGDGQLFFVLSGSGRVDIYSSGGEFKDSITLDGPADRISASQTGDVIYLTDRARGTTEMVSVSFVQRVDVEGSPFKGPASAPVVVAVFADFQ